MTGKHAIRRPIKWRRISLVVVAVTALLTVFFGLRTYGSFLLLRSAYEAGAPMTSAIRGWMTLDYVAGMYRIPNAALIERLALSPDTDPKTSLKSLADRAGLSPAFYVQRVQRAVANITSNGGMDRTRETPGWFSQISDQILTALLIYGYPVLGATLLLGAVGLPLPDGILTTFAGSLAAQGRLHWLSASMVAVTASVIGDAIGYGLGRLLGREVVERHGHWIGYTAARRGRVQLLFERWGSLTVFITRTFMSYLSSVASLLAGMSRYRLSKFLAIAFAGRVIWTAAYLGLGYGIGSDLEAATGFLTNLSLLLLSLLLLAGAGTFASGRFSVPGLHAKAG